MSVSKNAGNAVVTGIIAVAVIVIIIIIVVTGRKKASTEQPPVEQPGVETQAPAEGEEMPADALAQ